MNIAQYIDHTILKPTTLPADIEKLCDEAIRYRFAAVCVPPHYVALASRLTAGAGVATATVIGFPFGYSCIEAKVAEIHKAIAEGATELDIVINLCALKSGDLDYLSREITACLQPIRLNRCMVKVIIESGVLTDDEIVACCTLYARHKVDFVKTSTGYAEHGASVHAVQLMRSHLPPEIQIKASGGIRTFAFAQELVAAGATRIGASASVTIAGGS
ncbi:deoxyribose-phosphate aldolase [Taibaiella koreensis]|uniref:deoxyribose-phosphate aldolase n=1 Tax=Taibaiella koreensis TaxID=1268548 RepID=UPI000E59BC83|nr:deoxyribose-phosphate aldolase [Taibaiella koreensis]